MARELTRQGDDEVRLAVRRIVARASGRRPADIDLRLLLAAVETWLGRHDRAAEQIRSVVEVPGVDGLSVAARQDLLVGLLELARRGSGAAVLELMEGCGLDRRWQPVAHALAIASGRDPQRGRRLAPEMRAMTEDVLERIGGGL